GVDDPRLVRVLDVGSADGICWIVEEGLSEAISLASLVTEQPLPPEEARRIVGEAASGMESARRRGLHHLYLNPHAVLRTSEGSVKISGVGVAAALEQTDDISASEASVIDTTDLMSLLYTGLTGRWPGEDIEALRPARRLADGSLPAPSEVVAGVPGDLDALCRAVFGAGSNAANGPNTPGELAKVLAPWPSEVVHGPQHTMDGPVQGDEGGAYAALAAAAGASAAATAAHPADPDATDSHDAIGAVEPAYYRTQPAAGSSADPAGAGTAPPSAASGGAVLASTGWAGAVPAGHGPDAGGAFGGGTPTDSSELESASGGQAPQRFQSGVVLALVAAVVVVAMFLGYGAIQGLGGADDTPQAGATSTKDRDSSDTGASTSAEPEPAAQETSDSTEETAEPTEASGDPLTISGITSYDPEGDGDENNERTPLAIDGDTGTAWRSRTYLAENWGNLKNGVGLSIDLGESKSVNEVDVSFPQGDYGMQIYVGDDVSLTDMTQIGSRDDASGEVTITADEAAEGRYVLVWFDRAWAGPNGEIVYVSEVTVR
ncbi:MAG: hypothetical protein WA962_02955, partial [Ornithinimicrobium sp.]